MGEAFDSGDLAKSVTVKNVEGAGGTVGLAQLANDHSDSSLMVMGLVMVGAIATNQTALQAGFALFVTFVLFGLALSSILKRIVPRD